MVADLEVIDYLAHTIDDITNPDEPVTDLSDLVEAQTALVEVDRLGRVADDVVAYERYNQAISRFLDRRLAKSLKRHRRGELERTGVEAKQDLFSVLSLFEPTHTLMSTRLGLLLDGVSDFQSVDLTRVVSVRTVSRVRSSLDKVLAGLQRQQLSKTAVAVELMAGSSALSSISNSRKIYDPTVSTGSHPPRRIISISSERVPAIATGTGVPVDLQFSVTPWIFDVTVNGTNYQVTLPASGAGGRHYVKAATGSQTFNITNHTKTLHVQFDGIAPPAGEPVRVRSVELPMGAAVTLSSVLSALNNGATGLIDGTAVEMAPGTGRILIYGSGAVTGIIIRSVMPGTFDGGGVFTPAPGSAHVVLGFVDDQVSTSTVFTPTELADLLTPHLDLAEVSVVDGAIQIATESDDLTSSIEFGPGVASVFGFTSGPHTTNPSYLELVEDGVAVDPSELGVFVGSVVTAPDIVPTSGRNLSSGIISIIGTQLFFDDDLTLPRCDSANFRVLSPLVFTVQSLLDSVRSMRDEYSEDSRTLQRVLSPLLSTPTLAHIGDAERALDGIRAKVQDLLDKLSVITVREDRTEFGVVANQIASALEERNLDRSLGLLQSCQFSDFFALTLEAASSANRFLKATEEVGRNEFAKTTVEQDIDDLEPSGSTPDEDILPGEELMEDEEQL